MFLKMPTTRSTDNYSDKLSRLKDKIAAADAIVIGAGAGLSTAKTMIHVRRDNEVIFVFYEFEKFVINGFLRI